MLTGEPMPVEEDERRQGDRRHGEWNRQLSHGAERVGSETVLAQIVEMVARGATQPRADPGAGR